MAASFFFLLPTIPCKPRKLTNSYTPKITCSSLATHAKQHLLNLISDQERGVKTQTNSTKRAAIVKAIDALASLGTDTVTTGSSLSATWRLLWTTEKEQLFIIEKAYLFGTQAGDVLQRVNFRFTSAVLRGENWEIPLPPFGQGWFDTVYLDDEIRVVKDIRGDYLVVDRAPYNWKE
ncbi:probable plastid-lipid-associated protein 11, chloroplastic isoform X2 [Cannabis sativa]|uniref:probable plastid-lipid-associated protein 11, chloroplastic isoform X2 n=1 Tax=Cannabis sativa TaxID=3483 RepID=UPI0029CA72D4|nr:probable plastid-lipid-associated protein 11, chloroplastic isoform X2 [Cannabis sativa]XP_060970615.1 probable plastid-lipid-associated protein 11, chloroplastic isoform X2 [Cannabis sativa]